MLKTAVSRVHFYPPKAGQNPHSGQPNLPPNHGMAPPRAHPGNMEIPEIKNINSGSRIEAQGKGSMAFLAEKSRI